MTCAEASSVSLVRMASSIQSENGVEKGICFLRFMWCVTSGMFQDGGLYRFREALRVASKAGTLGWAGLSRRAALAAVQISSIGAAAKAALRPSAASTATQGERRIGSLVNMRSANATPSAG